MDERELAARTAELVRMFSAFPDKPDADRLAVYLEETASIPYPVFKKAVRSALRNQTETNFAPPVGKIVSAAGHFYAQYREELEEREEQERIKTGTVVRLVGPGE